MKIAIDYTLANQHTGGMEVFIRNIVNELKSLDKKNDYILVENPIVFNTKSTFSKLVSATKIHLWYQTIFNIELRKNKVDMLYSPNPPVPLLFNKPIFIIIPDMAFYYDRNLFSLAKIYLYISYYLAARKSKRIITISEHSKKDIQKILRVDKDKISVIPLAASDNYSPSNNAQECKAVLKKYKITKPYILSTPGTFLPRKNISALVESVSNLKDNLKNNIQIVLVGRNKGGEYTKLYSYIKTINMSKNTIFTGYVSNIDKYLLYQTAKIFVYPSLYEGFGLPPLEAMQSGIPVIVYNKTSLPEVVADAGILVNNTKELTKAIESLLINKQLYQKLRIKGLRRSNEFSWKKSAQLLLKDIQAVS